MMKIESLFFELIHVSLGNSGSLSHTPTAEEWGSLFDMAMKQSLVGICFAGVVSCREKELPGAHSIPEDLYYNWMGMAMQIQQRNELVAQRCLQASRGFRKAGFRSCILKGQGLLSLYDSPARLVGLRQSGDIDIWVDGDRDKTMAYVRSTGAYVDHASVKHADIHIFDDTEVELHFIPTWFYNPITEMKLKRWVELNKDEQFENVVEDGFCIPTSSFNLVFILIHIYKHLFDEGVGLRQLMDYYFVLMHSSNKERAQAYNVVASLGMRHFAGAVMYVIQKALGMKDECLLCPPNVKNGEFLLDEIMVAGNFGHHDPRKCKKSRSAVVRGYNGLKRNVRFLTSYPSEILWAPFWKVWHWCWRKKHGYL